MSGRGTWRGWSGDGGKTMSEGIRGIGQIALIVKDLERAVAFYRDVVGLTFLFQAPPALAFFDAAGAEVVHEPRLTHRDEHHELWLAYFNDTEGNAFALMAEVTL
jgi:methylmalonyl-CoA/ethylmalonyl-CoA epimerase